ncbi:MAG: LysR substrate-binding domain-containing protein, partial [Myxococcales bacterium]
SPDYLARRGRPRTPEEVLQHECLRYAHNTPHEEWRFERDGEPGFVPVPSRFSSNSGEVLLAAALAGTGLAIAPHFMVREALTAGALEEVLASQCPHTELGVWALYASRAGLPERVRALLEFLVARFRQGLT